MMSLNIFGSIKVKITLKSLAKTTNEIRDAKHRVLTAPNAIPNGFSRAVFRHSTIPQNSDHKSCCGDTAQKYCRRKIEIPSTKTQERDRRDGALRNPLLHVRLVNM